MEKRERVRPGPAVPDRCDGVRVPEVKSSRSRDTEKALVAGEDKGIDREVPKIDRNVARSLCSVNDEVNPMIVQDCSDAADILDGPEHIAAMGHDHEPGIRLDSRFEVIRINKALPEGEDGQPDSVLPFVFMERSQH